MRSRPVLFSLILVFSLYLFATLGTRTSRKPSQSRDTYQTSLLEIPTGEIQKLTLNLPSGQIAIKKTGQHQSAHPTGESWELEKPIEDMGNPAFLENLLRAFSSLRIRNTFGIEDVQTEFDWNHSPVSLKFSGRGNQEQSFDLGIENPIDRSLLLRRRGEKRIFKVTSPDLRLSTRTINDFRNPNLVSQNQEDISGIRIFRSTGSNRPILEVSREGSGPWVPRQTGKDRSQLQFSNIFKSILKAEVDEFVLEDKDIPGAREEYGLATPQYNVLLTNRQGRETLFQLSAPLSGELISGGVKIAATAGDRKGLFLMKVDLLEQIKSLERKKRRRR